MSSQMASAIQGFTEVEDERKDSSRVVPKARSTGANRRETILSLVEMLLRPGDEMDEGMNQVPAFEDDRDVPTVDEAHQTAGAEAFNKFQKRIDLLDKELRNFSNAARQLGSSAAILSSAFQLRRRLAYILFLYRENAADLFPRKISHPSPTQPSQAESARKRRLRKAALSGRYKALPHAARPTVTEPLDLEDFPKQFELLAEDVMTLLRCLNEFPEFTDEAVNASIMSFNGDLKYWSSCLQVYQGQFRYPAVQRYIQDLAAEMGDHIDNITTTLAMFIEVGVPTIRFAQKHGATNLLNLSTVATFFSAVTATTLQFSFEDTSPLGSAVNSFWFLSLVFSIGAAVNSLLGLTWKQAMYRSPGHRVPWWVLIWIKRSPLVFLVLSVMCFSVGLCVFAYSSDQHRVTSTITTVMTATTSFGLIAVSLWFASERWTFLRHQGRKWLGDVLIETNEKILNMRGMGATRKMFHWCFERFVSVARRLHLVKSNLSIDSSSDVANIHRGSDAKPMAPILENIHPGSPATPTSPDTIPRVASPVPGSPITPTSPNSTTPGKELWRNAIRAVARRTAISSNLANLEMNSRGGGPRTPHRKRTASSSETRRRAEEPVKIGLMRSRVSALVPKLTCLEATQDLAAHQALVRHLQFSPDGKFLATSSWDRTSVIFRVGQKPGEPPLTSHRILAHAKGFVGQVAWSPTSDLLLTKLVRGIKVWTQDGVCRRTIDRPAPVESITWFPGGEAFLSVEGSTVTQLDLKGTVLGTYHFGSMKLHDVAVTPDCVRLLGVGPLLESPNGLKPSKSRVEKRLVVYNMETAQIESTTPVLNDVRDITLARNDRNGLVALVSYEHKAPPQLWKIDLVKDRENNEKLARLTLRHTYMPKVPVDFAGPSYFGGKNDELVLCAGKAGDIHIWDQESGSLLHHIKSSTLGGDLTTIAWNHAAENPFMFATGSHDGAVRIWTKPTPESPEPILELSPMGSSITNKPRSFSPDDLLEETPLDFYMNSPRSESPSVMDRGDDSQAGPSNASGGTGERDDLGASEAHRMETPDSPLQKDRVVAFAEEPATVAPSSPATPS
ncbi:catabolite degradation [Moniliophthora roreri MCA 2997]|uniref:Catabolite degradation n=1 Tax=Moniliophthora roreri (strain MCA 2997) TaxID=1381753 RepID=V2WHR0_MONRO|nr:catabolite degradation [Moniliophthora roreri MCA 2997]